MKRDVVIRDKYDRACIDALRECQTDREWRSVYVSSQEIGDEVGIQNNAIYFRTLNLGVRTQPIDGAPAWKRYYPRSEELLRNKRERLN